MNSLNIDNKSTMSSKTFLLFVSLIFSVFAAIAVYFFEGHVKRDALNSIDQEFTEKLEEISNKYSVEAFLADSFNTKTLLSKTL